MARAREDVDAHPGAARLGAVHSRLRLRTGDTARHCTHDGRGRGGIRETGINRPAEWVRDLPEENGWEHAGRVVLLEGNASLRKGYYEPGLTPYAKLMQEAATGQWTWRAEGEIVPGVPGTVHPEDWWIRDLVAKGQR